LDSRWRATVRSRAAGPDESDSVHLLLTDRLCCPRCGPDFGLIALAQRSAERRLLEGLLGCPNCRERYPVQGGFADLRPPPRKPLLADVHASPAESSEDSEVAARTVALLGITEGPAYVLATGPMASHAFAISRLVRDLEVVTLDGGPTTTEEQPGVSRIAAGRGLPLRDRDLRGALLSGLSASSRFAEAARVVVPGGRLVIVSDPGSEETNAPAGFALLARERGWEVFERTAGRPSTGVKLPVV
jgi:uncharacterized protein YbaR (Trm112 family)